MRVRRSGWAVALVLAAVLSGCGGDDGDTATGEEAGDAEVGATDENAGDDAAAGDDGDGVAAGDSATDDAPHPAPPSEESCDDRGTALVLDDVVEGTLSDSGDAVHYCVEVPPGATELTFALSGLQSDATLWVAFDTYETVVEGGLGLKWSDGDETTDAIVTYEPAAYRGELLGFDTYADVTPGPYWIEITGDEGPYALVATQS